MSNQPRSNWNEPSPGQRLSHRTILRFQQLADELQQDLNALPLFSLSGEGGKKGKIKDVFFVSRDSKESEESIGLYYNARLLATFAFPPAVWKWLKDEARKKDGHFKKFETLFRAGALRGHLKTSQFGSPQNQPPWAGREGHRI